MSDAEIRVLGSLLEKERTAPELYPLTTNALLSACNQKTNRDPVLSLSQDEVEDTLRTLRDKGLVSTARAANERVYKHQHRLEEALNLNAKALAVLAVLMLRGQQTPGELRSRTERYVSFGDLSEVEETLERLAEHQPTLARNLGRGPGQSQDRWGHTLGRDEEKQKPRARPAASQVDELERLRAEVEMLRSSVARLYDHLELPFKPDMGDAQDK